MQEFEQRKAQLQQRVVLIEQLRKGQTGPVHMLDQISRALPPMLWLTELEAGRRGDVVDRRPVHDADRRCPTSSRTSKRPGYFKRSVEIVSTPSEAPTAPPASSIKFSVKAVFQHAGRSGASRAGREGRRLAVQCTRHVKVVGDCPDTAQ